MGLYGWSFECTYDLRLSNFWENANHAGKINRLFGSGVSYCFLRADTSIYICRHHISIQTYISRLEPLISLVSLKRESASLRSAERCRFAFVKMVYLYRFWHVILEAASSASNMVSSFVGIMRALPAPWHRRKGL